MNRAKDMLCCSNSPGHKQESHRDYGSGSQGPLKKDSSANDRIRSPKCPLLHPFLPQHPIALWKQEC